MKFLISNLRLLARRFKSVAIINVVGLGVAFAVLLVVAMQVRYDLSYDRGFKNSGRIFRLEIDWGGDWGFSENSNYQIPQYWKERVPEIENYALVGWGSDEAAFAQEGAGATAAQFNAAVSNVTSGFLEVFTPEIVTGDASATFDVPGHAMIPEKMAAAIFGGENPVGRVITTADDPDLRYTVDAVYREFPNNSSITNDVYTRTEPGPAGQYNWRAYIMFDPADHDAIMSKISDSMLLFDVAASDAAGYTVQKYALTGASKYYLHGSVGEDQPGQIGFMTYLLIIGGVILLVAVINFINLSMAMAPSRVRNVNIHRILGIGTGSLRASLSMEAVVMAAVAVAGGCLLVDWFSASVFTDFFTADLTLRNNIPLVAVCALGLLLVAFGVGAYTSRYVTGFDVAIALKSSFALSRQGARLRNTLVVVQFAAAIFFICFSAFVWRQYEYMSEYRTGYEKENIVQVPYMRDNASKASFVQELMRNPRVFDHTVSSEPGYIGSTWGDKFEGKDAMMSMWQGDQNMLRFFGVEIVAGDDFSTEPGRPEMVVNREFLRKYDFTAEQVIGKTFRGFTIVGVSADVNFESLHEPVRPMAFSAGQGYGNNMYLKIAGDDVPATLAFIEKTWNDFPIESRRSVWGSPDYSVQFLDDRLNALYSRELNTSRLIGILGMMAVAIAVMGVFGLIMFNTRYKTREIAIRKVNGATRAGVALMLNRNMLILVGVGFALAVPLTLVFITRWVEGFAYKAAVPWWLFPAGGMIVLAIAVATVSYQSWRAASANPVKALMSE